VRAAQLQKVILGRPLHSFSEWARADHAHFPRMERVAFDARRAFLISRVCESGRFYNVPGSRLKVRAACLIAIFAFSYGIHSESRAARIQPAVSRIVRTLPGLFRHYFPNTEIALPASYPFHAPQKHHFSWNEAQIDVYALRFAQGQPAYIEITPGPGGKIKTAPRAFFDRKEIRLTAFSWGYRGLFPIPPQLAEAPTKKALRIYFDGLWVEFPVLVEKTYFPSTTIPIFVAPPSQDQKANPKLDAFIRRCQEKKQAVFSKSNRDQLSSRLSFPRDVFLVTSPYFSRRVFQRYFLKGNKRVDLAPQIDFHNGLDMYARSNDPIFAMADGVAVIAENMFYEGGFIAIDHGNGIFTLYMHQSKLLVREGERVSAGQLIGRAGATGAAIGSHLHMSLFIDGIPVDPMGLLSLPIRS